jgi:hypothetical protein
MKGEPDDTFPGTRYKTADNQESSHDEGQEQRTFSVDPQEGVS